MRLRGEESLSDLPRPDRLGLVIKYLWALKSSSPSAAFMRFEVPSGNSFQLCSLSLKFNHQKVLAIWPLAVYILYIYTERLAMPKAKLFNNGGSQAVRLPAEFRFDSAEVDVRRDTVTGEVVLSKPRPTWDDYFAWVATLDLPADFLIDRDQPRDDL